MAWVATPAPRSPFPSLGFFTRHPRKGTQAGGVRLGRVQDRLVPTAGVSGLPEGDGRFDYSLALG